MGQSPSSPSITQSVQVVANALESDSDCPRSCGITSRATTTFAYFSRKV